MPALRPDIVPIFKRMHLFWNLEDQQIEAAARYFEFVDVPDNQEIYKEGDDPEYFYIIAVGQVKLSRTNPRSGLPTQLGVLNEDDYFGEEVLESNWPRQLTVTTVGETTLLRISVPSFIALLGEVKPLGQRLQLILDSFKLMLKTHFSWRDGDETVIFVARRHPIIMVQMIFPAVLLAGILIPIAVFFYLSSPMVLSLMVMALVVAGTLGFLVWRFVDWTNDYYVITSERVVFQEKVVLIYESRLESPLWAIQSTTIHTSQWGRWLNFGNVAIRTFYGTILFRDIANAEQVMGLVQQQQIRATNQRRRVGIQEIKSYLDTRMVKGPEQASLPTKKKPPVRPEPLQQFLSTMFHLRYVSGNTTIYRTHIFILLEKTLLPTLLLLGLGALFFLSAYNQFAMLSLGATCSLSILFGGIVFGWWFYQYMDWHNDIYLISPDKVEDVDKKPLGREDRQTAMIKNILSIEYKRIGLIGLIFNFGTVYIRVGDRELTFDNVYKPSEVQRELYHAMAKVSADEKKRQAEEEKLRLGDWFDSFNQWENGKPKVEKPPAPTNRPGF